MDHGASEVGDLHRTMRLGLQRKVGGVRQGTPKGVIDDINIYIYIYTHLYIYIYIYICVCTEFLDIHYTTCSCSGVPIPYGPYINFPLEAKPSKCIHS